MPDARPLVILNAADGKLDTVARRDAARKSPRDLERVNRLRASADAVMVGGHTLVGDDPRLTLKSGTLRAERVERGFSENPRQVGLATNLASLRVDSRFLTAGPAQVVLFTTEQSSAAQIARLGQHGAQVFVMGERRIDLRAALRHLKEMGLGRLLVQGGGTLNAELLRLDLVDEIYLYLAPLIVGGATAPTLADGAGLIGSGQGGMNNYFLLRRCRVPGPVALATGTFVVALTTLAASIGYSISFLHTGATVAAQVLSLAIYTVPGVVLGGQLGPRLARGLERSKLERLLAVIFMFIGGLTLWTVFQANLGF